MSQPSSSDNPLPKPTSNPPPRQQRPPRRRFPPPAPSAAGPSSCPPLPPSPPPGLTTTLALALPLPLPFRLPTISSTATLLPPNPLFPPPPTPLPSLNPDPTLPQIHARMQSLLFSDVQRSVRQHGGVPHVPEEEITEWGCMWRGLEGCGRLLEGGEFVECEFEMDGDVEGEQEGEEREEREEILRRREGMGMEECRRRDKGKGKAVGKQAPMQRRRGKWDADPSDADSSDEDDEEEEEQLPEVIIGHILLAKAPKRTRGERRKLQQPSAAVRQMEELGITRRMLEGEREAWVFHPRVRFSARPRSRRMVKWWELWAPPGAEGYAERKKREAEMYGGMGVGRINRGWI